MIEFTSESIVDPPGHPIVYIIKNPYDDIDDLKSLVGEIIKIDGDTHTLYGLQFFRDPVVKDSLIGLATRNK